MRDLWVLAGGNGTGKSTFYRLYVQPRGMELLSADLVAKRLEPDNPEIANPLAQAWVDEKRVHLLDEGRSFCYETVFSHPSKIDFLADAKARGYRITLIYLHLETTELNQARVRQRVSEGGHDVPPEKIVARIPRTMNNIAASLGLVDEAWLLDNSSRSQPFKTIAVVKHGSIANQLRPLPAWASEILEDF